MGRGGKGERANPKLWLRRYALPAEPAIVPRARNEHRRTSAVDVEDHDLLVARCPCGEMGPVRRPRSYPRFDLDPVIDGYRIPTLGWHEVEVKGPVVRSGFTSRECDPTAVRRDGWAHVVGRAWNQGPNTGTVHGNRNEVPRRVVRPVGLPEVRRSVRS